MVKRVSGRSVPVNLRERGQASLFIAMSLVVVLGVAGLAVDMGYAYYRRQAAKTAAQAAASAGVKVAQNSPNFVCASGVTCQAPTACPTALTTPTNAIQAACLFAKKNGFTDDPTTQTRRVLVGAGHGIPPTGGVNPTYWMSVTITEKLPGWFGAALGLGGLTVTARSTSAYFLPSVGGCIYTLEPALIAVTNSGNPTLSTGCGMYVNSTNPAAVSLNGNANIVATSGSDVNIVGGWASTGGATISPAPKMGVPQVADPFGALAPPTVGSCTSTGVALDNHQTATINPGVICGGINLAGQSALTLQPGLYVIKGGISATGQTSITGHGVTLYVVDGPTSLSGGATINLSAPTGGDWQGILLYQDRNNTNAASLVGNSTSTINGVLYFPNAGLSFSGGSSTNSFSATVVSRTLSLVGNTYMKDPVTTKYTAGNAGVHIIE